jgi:hypothetical protein
VSGIIKDEESLRNIRDNRKCIGDIIKVQTIGFEQNGNIVLRYKEKPLSNISYTQPPKFIMDQHH